MDTVPFKTSDLGLAAYLAYRGLNLVGTVESGEAGRLFFVFEDSALRDQAVEEWTTGTGDALACKKFNSLLRFCKRELKNPVRG